MSSHDAARGETFDAHSERNGLRAVVAAPDFQRFERGFPAFQQVVQDVVPSGGGLQVEIGKHGLQLLHVDVLETDLPRQRVGAPGQGRDQRVQRTAGRELQRQVAGRHPGAGRSGVGCERDAGGADAVGAGAVPDFDAVQSDAGGITARPGGRGRGVEQERSADPLRGESHLRKVEPGDFAREAHLLPLPGQCAGEEQRQPQGFVPVGEFSGEAVLFEVSFYPDAAEVAAAVLRAVYLCPEARPGLRLERIEPGAPGRQREVEHPQRVGRQEPVDRETVAPELGVVALLSGIETAVQDNPAGIDGKCRGDRECAPVGPGRAVEPDLVGNRHTAAQGRIGQQFHEEGQVAEIAFEAGGGVQRLGVEQILRPGRRR